MSSWSSTDRIDVDRAVALAGLLDCQDRPGDGDRLPLMWQLAYFLPRPAQAELGPDGHPRTGHLTPPSPDMRRMFAGGRVTMRPGLAIGDHAEAQTQVTSNQTKTGRSGPLTFLTTTTAVSVDGTVVMTEERNIVYLPPSPVESSAHPRPAQAPPTVGDPTISRRVNVDSALLFRFSALTYNAHRIHYDRDYARTIEGYPGLVVHGPLQALLMAELAREVLHEGTLTMTYRLLAPLFEDEGMHVRAQPMSDGSVAVEVTDSSERPTATATVSVTA